MAEERPPDVAGPDDAPGPDDADTEGHSAFNAEFGRQAIRDHAREAAELERRNALSRDARPRKSIRDRLFRR